MRTITFYLFLFYLVVAYGVIITFGSDNPLLGSAARIAGIPALGCWLLTLYHSGKVRKWGSFLNWTALFILWNGISFFWSIDTDQTLFFIYRYSLYFGAAVLVWDVLRTRKNADVAMQWFVWAGFILAIEVLWSYKAGEQALTERFSASGFNPNEVAKLCSIVMPISWYLAIFTPKKNVVVRILNFSFPLVATYAIILTGSRGGVAAAFPAYLYILSTYRRMPIIWKGGLYVALFAGMFIATQVDMSRQLARISSITNAFSGEDRLTGRLDIWEAGLNEFSKSPYVGVGAGGFPLATDRYAITKGEAGNSLVAHNTYLSIAVELGLVGFMLFMGICGTVLSSILKLNRGLRNAWIAAYVVWALAIFTGSWELNTQTWLFLSLAVSVASAYRAEEAKEVVEKTAQIPRSLPSTA